MLSVRIPVITAIILLFFFGFLNLTPTLLMGRHDGLLHVDFLDVGQGDATFIESPTGVQVLIDMGKGSSVLAPLGSVMNFFDRDLDMVIATHPDQDHIGGLLDILDRYTVRTVLMTENMTNLPNFEALLKRIHEEGSEIVYARRGQVYDLGNTGSGSTTLTILFPDRDPKNLESNTSSIVSRLVYGKNAYVFTGDSPQPIEEYLVSVGSSTLRSDVLKVGHHGSRTSSGEVFINAVHPEYAIISAGKNNSYGHPHKEVVDRLTAHNIQQKNTADIGSIFSLSDGTTVWFK